MDILQNSFDDVVKELIESAESEEELERIAEALPEKITEMLNHLPHDILESIKSTAKAGLAERRAIHSGFVERNIDRWMEGFNLLELLIEVSTEAGSEFNSRYRPEAVKEKNITFDTIVRLHAKGCLISKEIMTLFANGFADGAHARWRALHELNVTAMFLSKFGTEATMRYLEHEFVEAYKGACQLNKYEPRINAKGFSDKEINDFKKDYDRVVKKYGNEFKNPYGWAASFVNSNRPNFSTLEEVVGLDHWRPYYKWSSQTIHANVKTIKNSLGTVECKEDILQVGPSNSGMAEPAHSTAITLSQLTCTLLSLAPNIDDMVCTKIVLSLVDEIGDAFLECDKKSI
ncbi:hypothetical protein W04_2354 [Pseudoalteromonas sp. SW0106-04]|uniref:DUF5677 domain-containing protein n=1 Tax=Pseudoalteromonas sp. SW0106-04 TaxID=1702169 RepID=UPI0006B5DDBA|nr:DUF5677 domain-containing protein [Pseudoalteromonas sp. SW0106-04]GAP75815.1 hypothetical protein W04_2354 [Pseudoalteromonas sp. SW0106-04]